MGLSALVYFPILEARIHARSRQVITYMPVLLKQAPFHLAYSNTGFGMKPCKEGWHAGNLKHLGVPVVDLDKSVSAIVLMKLYTPEIKYRKFRSL